MTTNLLGEGEAPPFEVAGHTGRSPFVITCDHAGRLLPRALWSLGLSATDLASHIAWDLGAGALARLLASRLGAFVVWQQYSRLVIDCNRPLAAPDSIVDVSDTIVIPGNQHLGPDQIEMRAREIFHPYHDRVRTELDRRQREGQASILVALHSFTP